MEMAYTLVVVDMQPQFEAARSRRCVENVLAEIAAAKAANAAIIVLEYGGFGPTNSRITKAVRSYERGYFAIKHEDNGSLQVFNLCNTYMLVRQFRVVGVNYGACVKSTAIGLRGFDYRVEVIRKACRQPKYWDDIEDCGSLYTRRNVTRILQQNGILVS